MTRSVLICNERFLSRFGVDRILLLLARHLRLEQGISISFACLRYDEASLFPLSQEVITVQPPDGLNIAQIDRFAAGEVANAWRENGAPDVIVTGGWPFFSIAAKAASLGVRSIFIDAGAVPHDNFPDAPLQAQLELRRLRRATLPSIGRVVAISDFVRRSQSVLDRGRNDVETVLLGADHLDACRFNPASASTYENDLVATLRRRSQEGTRFLMSLGRFESFGYKNSAEIVSLTRSLNEVGLNVGVLILTGSDDIELPSDLKDQFFQIRTVSDDVLLEIMRICVVGVSLTVWEGFNLPLAEMLWLGKPVLAYLIGAHPEVVAHPWMLCASPAELTQKLIALLRGSAPREVNDERVYDAFRKRLPWSSTLQKWAAAVAAEPSGSGDLPRRMVLIDVSNSARDPANSGVIRVTRRLSAELLHHPRLDLVFVRWDDERGRFRRLEAANMPFLGSNAGPQDLLLTASFRVLDDESVDTIINAADPSCRDGPVLFLPEVILDGSAQRRLDWAKKRQLKIAVIFYDMLPIYESQHVSEAVAHEFPSYIEALVRSDAIWAISGFSLTELERYSRERTLPLPHRRAAIWLPGQFSDVARAQALAGAFDKSDHGDRIELLCVSTIEPRKNHRVMVQAFKQLRERRPDLAVYLTLVGNSYAGSDGLTDWVRGVVEADSHIAWNGILTDKILTERYQRSHFTIYPSLAEGFGLPIMESLWMGVPCLCNETGVMAELAADGGCLTVDMTDADAVSMALEALATDKDLYEALRRQASGRIIETWADYGREIADRLLDVGPDA